MKTIKTMIKTITNSQFLQFLIKRNYKVIPTDLTSGIIKNIKTKVIIRYSKEGSLIKLEKIK